MILTFCCGFFWRALKKYQLPRRTLWTLTVMVWGICYTRVREQPNLAHNLVTVYSCNRLKHIQRSGSGTDGDPARRHSTEQV